jgi:dinuclear metal center YbgI/SA1388 family protein
MGDATVRDIARSLEDWAPLSAAEPWDNPGLQVGRWDCRVTRGLIALDLTPEVIGEAEATGSNLIITHHPLFFEPIKAITASSLVGAMALGLAERQIAHYAIHTNLDAARGGVSFALARQLGIQDPEFLMPSDGEGETPRGIGTIGNLAEPVSLEDFLQLVASALGSPALRHSGDPHRLVERVAVCGGSGNAYLSAAVARGADAYVTGDVKYHQFFDALDPEGRPLIAFVDAGHYETEAETEALLMAHLRKTHAEIPWARTSHRTSPIRSFLSDQSARDLHNEG